MESKWQGVFVFCMKCSAKEELVNFKVRFTMKSVCLVISVVLGLLLPINSAIALNLSPRSESLIVKFVPGLSASEQGEAIAANGGTKKAHNPSLRLHVVRTGAENLQKTLVRYKADPRVERAEIDHVRRAAGTPSDTSYSSQWALPKIGWQQVFGTYSVARSTKVAILDSGIDATHPDLAGRVIEGTSIIIPGDSKGWTDATGHGTMMAGIIAAVTDNSAGIAGVAPGGVKVMPVTVLDASGTGHDSDIIRGIQWAVINGADVILMPFSNPTFSQALQDAITAAWSSGVVLVAATGNDRSSTPTFPSGNSGVVGVSATDQTDALYASSNYGTNVFLAAPGVDIYSTAIGGTYGYITGTSASSAIVAGVAAFMKAVDPALLTNGVIVGRLSRTAVFVPATDTHAEIGNGRIDMANAVADSTLTPVQPAGVEGSGSTEDPYIVAGRSASAVSIGAQSTPHPSYGTAGTATYVVTVSSSGNGNGSAALGISNLPAGVTLASFNPASVSFSQSTQSPTSILTLNVANSLPGGTTTNFTVSAGAKTNTGAVIVDKASQTITVDTVAPASAVYNSSFNVAAHANSALPVSITTNGSCSGSGSGSATITLTASPGTCTINYSQTGNGNYNAASPVTETTTVNLPQPTISGTPTTTATVGTAYSFTPSATNAASFSITGSIPPGLGFNLTTGVLSGTPTTVGTYSNIQITVTNVSGSAQLNIFSITVAPAAVNGVCGTSNGGLFSAAPTNNLCNSGTPSLVTGTSQWNWTCSGSNGGSTPSCSAAVTGGTVVNPGNNATVNPASNVSLNFSNVSNAGTVSVIQNPAPEASPANFRVITGSEYLISSTAAYSGTLNVCLGYNDATLANKNNERNIKIFHYDVNRWVDVTSSVDAVNNIVCGTVTSLSPFSLMEPSNAPGVPVGGLGATLVTTLAMAAYGFWKSRK